MKETELGYILWKFEMCKLMLQNFHKAYYVRWMQLVGECAGVIGNFVAVLFRYLIQVQV